MDHHLRPSSHAVLIQYAVACALCACALVGCHEDDEVRVAAAALLTAECTSPDAIPADGWVCPADRTLECGAHDVVFVADDETTSCAGEPVAVSNPGPFAQGTHTIAVSDQDGVALCSAQLTVVDTQPPVLTEHTLKLWPPNHKFHDVAVEDCVSANDACDGDLQAEFLWASSDEPIDALGDGHHAPDIGVSADAQRVCVRAERQGPEDGRVYKLGVRVVDDAGHEVLGECLVIIDHDQRGVTGVDSGEAYRVAFDGSQQIAGCGGSAPPPSPPGEADAAIPLDDAGAPPVPDAGQPTPPQGGGPE